MTFNESETILYQSADGVTKMDFSMQNETVWLSIDQMASLSDRDKSNISKHIKNIFEEGELVQEATVAKHATVQTEGDREVTRNIEYYNLDVVISVGYRARSLRGTQFHIWQQSFYTSTSSSMEPGYMSKRYISYPYPIAYVTESDISYPFEQGNGGKRPVSYSYQLRAC